MPPLKLAKRSFGPPPIANNIPASNHLAENSRSVSPESLPYVQEIIASSGTSSRPSKSIASVPNMSTTVPRTSSSLQINKDQVDSFNKLRRIDLRCVKHIHELKTANVLEDFHVNWLELKATMDLPRSAELYMTRIMHNTDSYQMASNYNGIPSLVRDIFDKSNISAKLRDDFDILESVVRQRLTTIQARLLNEGLIERSHSSVPSSEFHLQKSAKFKVYWTRRDEIWMSDFVNHYLNMSEEDLSEDSDAEMATVETTSVVRQNTTGNHEDSQIPAQSPGATSAKRKLNATETSRAGKKKAKVSNVQPTTSSSSNVASEVAAGGVAAAAHQNHIIERQKSPASAGVEFATTFLSATEGGPNPLPATSSQPGISAVPITPQSLPIPEHNSQAHMSMHLRKQDNTYTTSPSSHNLRSAPKIWFYVQNNRMHYQQRVDYLQLQNLSISQLFTAVGHARDNNTMEHDLITFQYSHRDKNVLLRSDDDIRWQAVKLNVELNARFAKMEDFSTREVEVLVSMGLGEL